MEEITRHQQKEVLSISCFDAIAVKARVTFDECLYRGVRVTFWSEETEESAKILDDVFDILFDEVMKMRREREAKTIHSIINE